MEYPHHTQTSSPVTTLPRTTLNNCDYKHRSSNTKTYTTLTQRKNKLGNLSQIIQEQAKLSIKLKDYKHIELETNNLIKVLQNAAKKAAPNSDP
jgi:hypothetical protein